MLLGRGGFSPLNDFHLQINWTLAIVTEITQSFRGLNQIHLYQFCKEQCRLHGIPLLLIVPRLRGNKRECATTDIARSIKKKRKKCATIAIAKQKAYTHFVSRQSFHNRTLRIIVYFLIHVCTPRRLWSTIITIKYVACATVQLHLRRER